MKKNHIGTLYALFLNHNQRFLKIMKLFICFLMACVSTAFATDAYSQSAKVNVKVEQGHAKEVLKQIESQTDYLFVYNSDKVNLNKKVSINVTNETVAKVLEKVFGESEVNYVLEGNNILLTKKQIEVAKVEVAQQDNKIAVKGVVTDAAGESVIGASIVEKGTTNGVLTDIDGNFSLEVSSAKSLLEVSYIGYEKQLVKVVPGKLMKIVLREDAQALDEVVVVGYAVQKKVNLSGAVDAISSKALENRPIINAGQGLQGVIPNLNITINNGSANSAPSFNVRGITSLNSDGNATSGEPLILVDNIPTTASELSRLNTNDIENISVLKDASSAAIYGARAAFGVVLVTTKRAKTEKIAVGVNAYYSTRKITRLPEHVTDPYVAMTVKNDAAYPLYNLYNEKQLAIAKDLSANPNQDRVVLNPDDPESWLYYGSTDWMDEVYESSAPSYTVNFNVSQKTKKTSYYLSAEYARQDGMLKYGNDIYNRYNIRGKVDFQITDWLNLSNNTSFVQRTYDQPSFGRSDWGMSDFFHQVNRTNTLDVPRNPDGSWTSSGGEILGSLQEGGRKVNDSREFSTSFGLTLDVIKDVWQVKADATWRRDSELNSNSYHNYYYKTGPDKPEQASGRPTRASRSTTFYNYNVYNLYTDFHKTFGGKHYVQALLGFNQETRRSDLASMYRDNLISPSFPTPELATGDMGVGEEIYEWAVRGMFFRANYIYNDKYILEVNGRYDGTSRFPKNDRFGFFPSGSVAWLVSQEKFMQNFSESIGLNLLKIRGSYGVLGNQNVSTYAYIPTMDPKKISQVLDGSRPVAVYAPGAVSNTLTWEKVRTLNGGIDVAFLNYRLSAGFDYFVRYTEGMLTKSKTLPSIFGRKEPKTNAADLKTKGWELSLKWNDQFSLAGSPFHYSVKVALSDSRSFITKFDNKVNVYDEKGNKIGETASLNDYYEGQEIGEMWGLTTEGFFQNEEELKNHADQSAVGEDDQSYKFYVGDLKFADLNNDGKINKGKWTLADPGDFRKIGNSSSRYPYSFDLSADWKGFDIRGFFQGIGKRDWYAGGGNHYFWGIYAQPWTNVQVQNLDHWTPENPNAYYPRVKAYIAESTGSELACVQTKYMQDASYLRMKNLTVGYTLPETLTRKWNIERLRFYFSGENLFEISHLKANLDPEALSDRSLVYPLQRSYSFGVNLTF